MRAIHSATSAVHNMEPPAHAVPSENIQRHAGSHNIDDGIDRAHLVKMNLVGRNAMNFPFRHRHPLKNRQSLLLSFTHAERPLPLRSYLLFRHSFCPWPLPCLCCSACRKFDNSCQLSARQSARSEVFMRVFMVMLLFVLVRMLKI